MSVLTTASPTPIDDARITRPRLPERMTTLVPNASTKPDYKSDSGIGEEPKQPDSGDMTDEMPSTDSRQADKAQNVVFASDEVLEPLTFFNRRFHDFLILIGIVTMLAWPWAFWGAVRSLHGVKMRNSLAKVVKEHPQSTAFFVSLIGNFVCLVVDIFFSLAVIRFAQEWVAERTKVSVFHVSLLGAFRHQSFPWTMGDLKTLIRKNKWLPVTLVGFCILSFQFVPSGTTSLLLPVPFKRTEALKAHELNFASSAADCNDWLSGITFGNDCDWQTYKGVSYTSCIGQNQLLDILAAGRSSMLSLIPNNTESLSLNQLGAKDGMRLLGPLRGILPLGPNGVPAFDTLEASALSNPDIRDAMLAYNYTLHYQGLSSNVTCKFDSESPIVFAGILGDTLSPPLVLRYSGICPEGTDFLLGRGVIESTAPVSRNNLGYWACKAPSTEERLPAYYVYLRGRRGTGYEESVGNMTCLVSPIQFAAYPVTYRSETRLFTSGNSTSLAQNAYLDIIEQTLVSLSGVVREAQSSEANLVAEAVITAGVKSFGFNTHGRDDRYLPLFAKIIEGILDYEATYYRLLYSSVESPPASCVRDAPGEVTYTVIGWTAKLAHIGFLMPMTILNLAALGIILVAIVMTKPGVLQLPDPTHPLPLLNAIREEDKGKGEGRPAWQREVSFSRSEAIPGALSRFKDRASLPSGKVLDECNPLELQV